MKKRIGLAVVIILAVIVTGVGYWNYYYPLDAPPYFDSDGATLWKYQMSLVEEKSNRPYLTRYNMLWNGIEKEFELFLWNKERIQNIEVYALYQHGPQQLIYSTEGGPIGENSKYVVLEVEPPAAATYLKIVVISAKGNITKDVIAVSPKAM